MLRTDDIDVSQIEPLFLYAGRTTRSRTIGIVATPLTKSSRQYAAMKQRWVSGHTIIEPDCHDWVRLIADGTPERINLESSIGEITRWQADIILIVSSSYSILKDHIARLAGPTVRVLDAADYI